EGESGIGHLSMIKLGAGSTFALLVVFARTAHPRRSTARTRIKAETQKVPATMKPHAQQGPFRFIWQTDVETHFTLASPDFANRFGPKLAALLGRTWSDIAKTLRLDPNNEIADALSRQQTFSGIRLRWPVEGLEQPLAIEMSGLPMFDKERRFTGFRGFGVCREPERIADPGNETARHAATAPPKVLTFPAAPAPVAGTPLSPKEHSAFQELARELSERLRKTSARAASAAARDAMPEPVAPPAPLPQPPPKPARDASEDRSIFDRLPTGVLVYRLNSLMYANRAFLDWAGYSTLDELAEAGGLDSLFIEVKDESRDA